MNEKEEQWDARKAFERYNVWSIQGTEVTLTEAADISDDVRFNGGLRSKRVRTPSTG